MEKRDKTEVSDEVIDDSYAGYQYDEEIGRYYQMVCYFEPRNQLSISQDDSLAAESDLIEVDEKHGKTFSNPIGLFGHLSIEDVLNQYFKGTSMEYEQILSGICEF
ncbi:MULTISPECIES: hypothetical protein [Bacillus]|uniref:hypothetical protein n=1 Tax=Bacillus sp. MBGLi79 TaxID=2070759 RepID=UPI001E5D8557|nr:MULTISPECIES: hypothetical protein [Bacillus]MCM2581473.1 hypothetical protein [Bacillus stercoris]